MAILCAAVASLSAGCFKKESYDTIYRIAVWNQEVSGGELTRAADLESYAYYVDTTFWYIASWEDALARVITYKEDPTRQLTVPDVTGQIDAAADFQVALPLTAETSMLVVIDKAGEMYAYRKYISPINIEQILTQLHIYSWRTTYTANGWRIVNPFPDKDQDSPESPNPDDGDDSSGDGDDGTGDDDGNDDVDDSGNDSGDEDAGGDSSGDDGNGDGTENGEGEDTGE